MSCPAEKIALAMLGDKLAIDIHAHIELQDLFASSAGNLDHAVIHSFKRDDRSFLHRSFRIQDKAVGLSAPVSVVPFFLRNAVNRKKINDCGESTGFMVLLVLDDQCNGAELYDGPIAGCRPDIFNVDLCSLLFEPRARYREDIPAEAVSDHSPSVVYGHIVRYHLLRVTGPR